MKTLGIERERFIINNKNEIVPEIGILLPEVNSLANERSIDNNCFTYELFAGQIEDRTTICNNLKELKKALQENDLILNQAANKLGLDYEYSEFVDGNRLTDLKVNPFNQRHQEIFAKISTEQKIAASQVAAVHVHIGVESHEVTSILNSNRDQLQYLIKLGDHSQGKRINSYQIMAGEQQFPPLFNNIDEVMNYIKAKDGEKNVYDLIRYKPSTGTIEFRMFGITEDIDEIINYASECQRLVLGRR